MIDLRFIDELSRRINDVIPPGAREFRKDLEKNVRAVLHAGFEKLDLVTRDEFALQEKVLEHTRTRLLDLERQIIELEQRLNQQRS